MRKADKKGQCAAERKARMEAVTKLAGLLKISLIRVERPDGDVGYAFNLREAAKMVGCSVAMVQFALSPKRPRITSAKGCKLSRTVGKSFRAFTHSRRARLVTMAKLAI